jgi:hypothetical protein
MFAQFALFALSAKDVVMLTAAAAKIEALKDVGTGFWEEKEPLVGMNAACLAMILGV